MNKKVLTIGICLAAVAQNSIAQSGSCPTAVERMFSIDIASDHEVSDPTRDLNEAFDPGDLYSNAAAVTFPGVDGIGRFDDNIFLGADIWPAVPDFFGTSAAPVGACAPPNLCAQDYFDLDAQDTIMMNPGDLATYTAFSTTAPYASPVPSAIIPPFYRQCVHRLRALTVSFDDDKARGWWAGGNSVPVDSTSPMGNTYGSTAARDEIVRIRLMRTPGGPTPFVAALSAGAASETDVHPDLAPNPIAGSQDEDDDVDALDMLDTTPGCETFWFSADHEAKSIFHPGIIYASAPGGPVPAIRPDVHLGIPGDGDNAYVDIDAFEWVFLPDTTDPTIQYLAVLFSVDDDDPTTALDESGGLSPNVIYASFLNGTHFKLFYPTDDLDDDVDAIANWCDFGHTGAGPFDLDLDFDIDLVDFGSLQLCFSGSGIPFTGEGCEAADADGDGDVDLVDVGEFQLRFTGTFDDEE